MNKKKKNEEPPARTHSELIPRFRSCLSKIMQVWCLGWAVCWS